MGRALSDDELATLRSELAAGNTPTVWFTGEAVGVTEGRSGKVMDLGAPAEGDFIQVRPAGSKDVLSFSAGEVTTERPPRKRSANASGDSGRRGSAGSSGSPTSGKPTSGKPTSGKSASTGRSAASSGTRGSGTSGASGGRAASGGRGTAAGGEAAPAAQGSTGGAAKRSATTSSGTTSSPGASSVGDSSVEASSPAGASPSSSAASSRSGQRTGTQSKSSAEKSGGQEPGGSTRSGQRRQRTTPGAVVTLTADAEGQWHVEVTSGKKRVLRATPVPPSAVAQAAHALHDDVAAAVEPVLESARERQRARVDQLQQELDNARRLLEDLDGQQG